MRSTVWYYSQIYSVVYCSAAVGVLSNPLFRELLADILPRSLFTWGTTHAEYVSKVASVLSMRLCWS